MIVRVRDADDVSFVGALAPSTGLELAVRSGGHRLANHGASDRRNVRGLSEPATPEAITTFVAEGEAAAEELSTMANVMLAPPLPFVHHGRPIVMATLAYAGRIEERQRAVAPFRALVTLIADMVRPTRYPEIYPREPE